MADSDKDNLQRILDKNGCQLIETNAINHDYDLVDKPGGKGCSVWGVNLDVFAQEIKDLKDSFFPPAPKNTAVSKTPDPKTPGIQK